MAGLTSPSSGLEHEFLSHLPLIERVVGFVARRHHLSAADADDFASHVKLALIEDDYAVFRKFQGRATMRTFLTVVVTRMFLDYRNSAWGKWRPSAEAKRIGPLAVLLEQLMVRDGFSFEEACEIAVTNHRAEATRPQLEAIASRLPVRFRRRVEPDDRLADLPSSDRADSTLLAGQARAESQHGIEALNAVLATLDSEDRLVLTLRFTDGRTVPEIAAVLGLRDPKPLYRRMDALLRQLRAALQARGVDASRVLAALEVES